MNAYPKAKVGDKLLIRNQDSRGVFHASVVLCIGVYDESGDVRTCDGMVEYGNYFIMPDTFQVTNYKPTPDGPSKQSIEDYIKDGYQYDENGNLYRK